MSSRYVTKIASITKNSNKSVKGKRKMDKWEKEVFI